jgi:hypothetical protein
MDLNFLVETSDHETVPNNHVGIDISPSQYQKPSCPQACLFCKKKKTRCEGNPCEQCVKRNRACIFGSTGKPKAKRPKPNSEAKFVEVVITNFESDVISMKHCPSKQMGYHFAHFVMFIWREWRPEGTLLTNEK